MANLPRLGDLSYMAMLAEEIGIARSEPISWMEISGYCQATGRELTKWEAETLRKMSVSYGIQAVKSQNPKCLAPTFTASKPTEQTRSEVDSKIRNALSKRSK